MNGENYPLEQAIEIINCNQMKCNSLKNCYLGNIINTQIGEKILNYLNELECDLNILCNLISNFQFCFHQNLKQPEYTYNNECITLDDANNEIFNFKNGNALKQVMNNKKNKANGKNSRKKVNKTFNIFKKDTNDKRYNTINGYGNLWENSHNNCDLKSYGRLTYCRSSNENKTINNYSNIPNIKKNIINNKNVKTFMNRHNDKDTNNLNRDMKKNSCKNNICRIKNNDINNFNNIDENYIKNLIKNDRNININSENNLCNNNNLSINMNDDINNLKNPYYSNLDNNINDENNTDLNFLNNNENNYFDNMNKIVRKNYSSYEAPRRTNIIMNSKRMSKYLNPNNFNKIISEIQKDKKDKKNRINNILGAISGNENKLFALKKEFGNNIEYQLLNGDINDIYLEKIENFLINMDRRGPLVPLSKRYQIEHRARSNSAFRRKRNIKNNDNKSGRTIKKKYSIQNIKTKNSRNGWNKRKDLLNKRWNYFYK
jgi:hypothetical protein